MNHDCPGFPGFPGFLGFLSPFSDRSAGMSRDLAPGPFRPNSSFDPTPRPAALRTRIFLGTCWAAMLLAAFWLVVHTGFWLPWKDDYGYMTPVLIGDQLPTLGWLWERYADNLIPFAKVMNLALLQLTGWEFRAAAFVNVLALGAVALMLARVAARLRGRWSLTDALFPLILLSWAHWENIVWGVQLHFVMSHVVVLALLILVAVRRSPRSAGAYALAGGLVLVLPVLGPSAVAYVPALSVWLGYLAIDLWRESPARSRWAAIALGSCATAALALTALYFVGIDMTEVPPSTSGEEGAAGVTFMERLGGVARAASMVLAVDRVSMAGAEEGRTPLWVYLGAALLAFYVSTAALLCRAWWRRADERLRAAGLLAFLASAAALFVVLNKVRGYGDQILTTPRYALFAVPPLCAAVYAWVLYGPRRLTTGVQAALCCAALALLPLNTWYGWHVTALACQSLGELADDVGSGKPSYVLANQHCSQVLLTLGDPAIDVIFEQHLERQFNGLRQRGFAPFDAMAPDPKGDTIPLASSAPAATENIDWDGEVAQGAGIDSSLTFVLPRSQFVLGVRLRYALELRNDRGWLPSYGRAAWQFGVDGEKVEAPLRLIAQRTPVTEGEGRWVWIWVNQRIDRLHLHPHDGPFRLGVKELALLVPNQKGTVRGATP